MIEKNLIKSCINLYTYVLPILQACPGLDTKSTYPNLDSEVGNWQNSSYND